MTRLLPLLVLVACTYSPAGDRVGDWFGTLSATRCEWLDREGAALHWVYAATLDEWRKAGHPEPRIRNVEACWEPADPSPGPQAYLASSTPRHVTLSVRRQESTAVEIALIGHELLHAFSARSGLGVDRAHRVVTSDLENKVSLRLWSEM